MFDALRRILDINININFIYYEQTKTNLYFRRNNCFGRSFLHIVEGWKSDGFCRTKISTDAYWLADPMGFTQGQLTQILKHTDILKNNNIEAEFKGFSYGGPLNRRRLQVKLILSLQRTNQRPLYSQKMISGLLLGGLCTTVFLFTCHLCLPSIR